MSVWYIITKDGVHRSKLPKNFWTPAELYRRLDASVRYVVGYDVSDFGVASDVLVLDLYASLVNYKPPYVEPHWVEGYDDMDHALAALVLTFTNDPGQTRKVQLWKNALRDIMKEEEKRKANDEFERLAALNNPDPDT